MPMEGLENKGTRRLINVSLPDFGFSSHFSKTLAAPVPLEKVFCHYLCQICADAAKEPVLNIVCGHLCIYKFSNTSKFGEQCPVCSSHMNISFHDNNGDHYGTIISLCSGPKPGIYYCPMYESEPEEDEEEAHQLKEEAVSSRDTYVPPHPMFNGGCRYSSATKSVSWLIHDFGNVVAWRIPNYLESLQQMSRVCVDDVESVCRSVTRIMDRCIENILKGLQWALGQKKDKYCSQNILKASTHDSEQLHQHYEYNSRIYLWPNSSEFPLACASFLCKICCKPAYEPVVTRCGHLFCWSCLYVNFGCNPDCDEVGRCPFCSYYIDIYHGCVTVNPIYCGGGLCPEDEDLLLISGRGFVYKDKSNIDEILHVPRRPVPVLACQFMPYIFEELMKKKIEIKNIFGSFLDKRNTFNREDIHHTAKEVQDELDSLHLQLTKKWEKKLSNNQFMKRFHLLQEDLIVFPKMKINPVASKCCFGEKFGASYSTKQRTC